jgi:hypothetical protein
MNQLPSGWRFRTNWRGQMILQRQERVWGMHRDWALVWRDAVIQDLQVLFKE